MKYDNLRLCNDYIADMEGQLDAISAAVGVARGRPEALLAAVRARMTYAVTLENAAREVISEHKHGFLPARLLNAIDRLDAALAKNPSPSGDKPGISPAGDEAHEIRRDTCGQCDAYPTTPGPQHAQACSEYRTYSKTEGA